MNSEDKAMDVILELSEIIAKFANVVKDKCDEIEKLKLEIVELNREVAGLEARG